MSATSSTTATSSLAALYVKLYQALGVIFLSGMQNHCCAPSMYTKVVEAEGESRLVFFARTDIKPGQELTYDYR